MCLEAITFVQVTLFASVSSKTGILPRVHLTGLGYVYVTWLDLRRKLQQYDVFLNLYSRTLMLTITGP